MKKDSSIALYIMVLVVSLVVLRFILTGTLPLLDKTEARYAEIARLMVETGDWVVPQIDYGIPFWAKPPLSTWFSALSIKMFGANELAVRLPSFLLHIALLIGLGFWAKLKGFSPYLLAFVLLTTPEFLIHTGVVSTDSALGICVALAMIAFWEAIQEGSRPFWKHLFFLALGLGLLAKGPIVLILTLPPILIWTALHRINLLELIKKLGLLHGLILILVIAAPWYILAELKTPGFLDYFILGEHFKRFVDPSWQGDMYGVPKSQPFGAIWLFLFIFGFPWVQLIGFRIWKKRKTIFSDNWISFLILWFLWTPIFFTFSRNILHTYILPSMVPMALLALHFLREAGRKRKWMVLGSVFPILVFLATIVFITHDEIRYYLNTDKYLLSKRKTLLPKNEILIFYWKRKSYSGQFYAREKINLIADFESLDSILRNEGKIFMIVANKNCDEFSAKYEVGVRPIDANYKTSIFLLQNTNFVRNSLEWKEKALNNFSEKLYE